MIHRTLLATAALTVFGAAAQGQAITGGQVGLAYDRNITHGASRATVGGSLDLGLMEGLTLQADLAGHSRSAATDSVATGAHLIYDLGSQAAVGGFLTYENWSGNFHDYDYGIEGRFSTRGATPLTVEGYLMRVARNQGRSDFNGFGLDAALDVSDRSSIRAGYFAASGSADLKRFSFGLSYDLSPSLVFGLNAARVNAPGHHDNVVGLSIDYKFGTGALFGRRGLGDMVRGF